MGGQDMSEIRPDDEIWYDDGNIVLVVQERVAFRVHRGVLAENSHVFHDMFSIPQPLQDSELFDGCPLVHLSDTADDVRQLLRMLYRSRRHWRDDQQLPFSLVASVVRLSHKYEIEDLRDDALARMKTCFSEDLDTWGNTYSSGGSSVMSFNPEDAIEAVNISNLVQDDSMLLLALYACCQLETSILLRGVCRADGTKEQLNPKDMETCVNGQKLLLFGSISALNQTWKPQASLSCTRPTECEKSIMRILNFFCRSGYKFSATCESTKSHEFFINTIHGRGTICADCAQLLTARDLEQCLRAWRRLPKHMNMVPVIPGWGQPTASPADTNDSD